MEDEEFQLTYSPLFYNDLNEIIYYISHILQNNNAANTLLDNIENAIFTRLINPISFEPVQTTKKRKHPYYRIYVGKYTIYYVVIDKVMEVRRILYNARNMNALL